jgi:hypothetical protein
VSPRLPADPIRQGEAIMILAGRCVSSASTAYNRQQMRLLAAVSRGTITRYVIADRPHAARYSRTEVESLRAQWCEQGDSSRTTPKQRRADRLAALERQGLVSARRAREVVAANTGWMPSRSMPDHWGRQAMYGARRIDSEWFFPVDALPSKAPTRRQRSIALKCANCGALLERRASRIREMLARGGTPRCDRCWRRVRSQVLLDARRERIASGAVALVADETRSRMSQAQREAWRDGRRDRDRQAEVMRGIASSLRRSPKRHVEQIEKMMSTRGVILTPERRRQLEGNALSRAQRGSGRSQTARRQELLLSELWTAGKTVAQIADELSTTIGNVKRVRRRLGLPQRAPGRPARK